MIKRPTGFTLIEILVVVVILGVIAGVAWPQYTIIMEKFRCEQGKQLLQTIFGAQKRYFLDNNTYTNSWTALHVKDPRIGGGDDNNNPFPTMNPINCVDNTGEIYVGSLTRNIQNCFAPGTIAYILYISRKGNITCADGFWPGYCRKMGFDAAHSFPVTYTMASCN